MKTTPGILQLAGVGCQSATRTRLAIARVEARVALHPDLARPTPFYTPAARLTETLIQPRMQTTVG